MELNKMRVQEILNTLPIGYYTGRRVGVTLDETAETSYYSIMTDSIVVSFPILKEIASHIESISNEEQMVRSMLYHEVSHAIMTPTCLYPDKYVNIMEDERIETVLRNYYHDVNFRKQLYDCYGGMPPKATNTTEAFFNAVRFGLGPAAIQKEINSILNEYGPIMRNTPRYSTSPCVREYEIAISNLLDMVKEYFGKDPEEFQPKSGSSSTEAKDSENTLKNQDKQPQDDEAQGDEAQDGEAQPQNASEGENHDGKDAEMITPAHGRPTPELNTEELKAAIEANLTRDFGLSEKERNELEAFRRSAEIIISNFNKKNAGGNGMNTYSGVFNPRNVVRNDYRYFERTASTNGNNKFGTCHLNLFIDRSGSFWDSQNIMNGILAVLTDIEKKNKNFKLDVYFINTKVKKCENVNERQFVASGGNDIPQDMPDILRKAQKQQTCNYNIVLFDGDALSDCWVSNAEKKKRFKSFDIKQTTLITDPDNEVYINGGFTTAKVVITKRYTSELIKNVLNCLTIAFN